MLYIFFREERYTFEYLFVNIDMHGLKHFPHLILRICMNDCTLTLAKFSNILYETPFYTVVYFWIACQTIKVFIFSPRTIQYRS